ncbi:MAG: YceI family protein [Blastocatellales bacterium]
MRFASLLRGGLLPLLTVIVFASASGAEGEPAGVYEIDPGKSEITAVLNQEGLMGRLRPTHTVTIFRYSGRVELPPGNEIKGSAAIEAESASLANTDRNISEIEKREFENILHNTVLETSKFKSIEFQSTAITGLTRSGDTRSFTLNGKLKLRGVTRDVSLPVKVTVSGNKLTAVGEGRFKQSDFGITPYTGGFGAIKIGDEVKVRFNVVANAKGGSASAK